MTTTIEEHAVYSVLLQTKNSPSKRWTFEMLHRGVESKVGVAVSRETTREVLHRLEASETIEWVDDTKFQVAQPDVGE